MSDEWTDAELLDYIEHHSHTELALVAKAHVKRFLALAGKELNPWLEQRAFIPLKYPHIKDQLEKARSGLKQKGPK